MNPILLAAGALVVAGGIGCVAGRRATHVAGGAALLLAASPLLADPMPSGILIAERLVGAALAGELLWLALRGRVVAGSSSLGWPPLALIAIAAFAAGFGVQRIVPGAGTAEALGTAAALFSVAAVAIAGRPDGVHTGFAALVLVAASETLRLGLSGRTSALESLLVAGLSIAVAGVVALLVPRTVPGQAALEPESPEPASWVAVSPDSARAARLRSVADRTETDAKGGAAASVPGRRR